MKTSRLAAQARARLDDRVKALGPSMRQSPPVRGWIKAIREALGMTAEQLAKRLGVKQPSVVAFEQSEVKGTIELATLRRYDLPVKIVLFDNRALGMVRQWQELFHDKRYSEVDLSDNPDFCRVAESMGIPAFRVEDRADVSSAIDRLLAEPGPVLAHVLIHQEANVWPIVGPGRSNSEMLHQHEVAREVAR